MEKTMENKNKLTIIFLLMLVTTLSSVFAETLYSGESMTITLPEEYSYYTIVGNSSPVILQVEANGLDVIITADKYSVNDNFSLVFFNKEKETITQTIYTGGGGSSSSKIKYVDRNITKNIPIYINDTKEVEVKVPVEVEKEVIVEKINKYSIASYIVIIILALIIAVLIKKLFLTSSYESDWDRRLNNIVEKVEEENGINKEESNNSS